MRFPSPTSIPDRSSIPSTANVCRFATPIWLSFLRVMTMSPTWISWPSIMEAQRSSPNCPASSLNRWIARFTSSACRFVTVLIVVSGCSIHAAAIAFTVASSLSQCRTMPRSNSSPANRSALAGVRSRRRMV